MKLLEENIGVNLRNFGFGMNSAKPSQTQHQKHEQHKKKHMLNFKIKTSHYQENEKITHRIGKYLQTIYPIRNLNLKYIKNPYNSTVQRQPHLKMDKVSDSPFFQVPNWLISTRKKGSTS